MEKLKIAKQPLIVSIIMLFLAIPPMWPYGYYMLLRLVVCGVSIYVLAKAKEIKNDNLMWGMGFIAVLFNPLIPVALGKGLWAVIDIVVAIIFLNLLKINK